MEIVRYLDYLRERTPGGAGLRVWVWANKPGAKCKHTARNIEIYESDRYFTVTGRHLEGTPTAIAHRQSELDDLYNKVIR